jgi:hypothetical protein
MERDADGVGWHTSLKIGGTPGKANTILALEEKNSAQSFTSNANPSPMQSKQSGTLSTAAESEKVYPTLLLCEVQIEGRENTHEEFLELCNPTEGTVDITGWYIQRKTKTGDWSTFAPKTLLEGKSIPPRGTFVLAISDSPISHDVGLSYGLTADNSLVLKNPAGNVSDMLGWGEASSCEGNCVPAPPAGSSIARKFSASQLQDTNDNAADFMACANPAPSRVQESCIAPVASNNPPVDTAPAPSFKASATLPLPNFRVVIYEVRISGGEGKTSEDKIVLLNVGPDSADISGWKLRKRTLSGSESSVKVLADGATISPGGKYTWANSANGYAINSNADTSSTATLSDNNSIALQDASGAIKDSLAWGSSTNPFSMGNPAPNIPATQVLRRREVSGIVQITGDNAADYEIAEQ